MGSQATAERPVTVVPQPSRGRRPGGPATPLVPDALGRAVNRTNRLDALTRELRAAGGKGRTSAWLADRLGVSARTVKRDVTALQHAGVPIRASSGPQGGYVIDRHRAVPSADLTPAEVLAVVVGLQAAADQPFAAAADNAVAKILRALAPEQRAGVAQLANRVWIRPGELSADPDGGKADVRQVLAEATGGHHVVIIDYQPADGPPILALQVEPLGFAQSRGSWFALAWCRDSDTGRWFQLDHITAAQPTHEPFEARDVREVFGSPATG